MAAPPTTGCSTKPARTSSPQTSATSAANCAGSTPARSASHARPSSPTSIEVNELVTRLAHDTRQAGGTLAEWYGERTLHALFDGALTPDSYGKCSDSPSRPPAHLLLELDRATETAERLREKATRYGDLLPDSPLADTNPLVILAVPTPARARTATAAVAGTHAPLAVVVWSPASTHSALATVTTAGALATNLSQKGTSELE